MKKNTRGNTFVFYWSSWEKNIRGNTVIFIKLNVKGNTVVFYWSKTNKEFPVSLLTYTQQLNSWDAAVLKYSRCPGVEVGGTSAPWLLFEGMLAFDLHVKKQTGYLQWRIVPGIILRYTTNSHRAHLGSRPREGCSFRSYVQHCLSVSIA